MAHRSSPRVVGICFRSSTSNQKSHTWTLSIAPTVTHLWLLFRSGDVLASFQIEKMDAVSFSGCGALNFYQTGVGYGLQQAWLLHSLRLSGASAGAGLAMALAGGLDARDIAAQMIEITGAYGEGRILRPAWAYEVAQEFCKRFITPVTYERAKERIAISVTCAWPTRPWLITHFDGAQDMADALIASCFLPHRAQQAHTFRGLPCVDGGFSNNQPVIGDHCLKVSPFWFHAASHVRPGMQVRPDFAMRVPTAQRAWWLFHRGVRDFESFANQESPSRFGPLRTLRSTLPDQLWTKMFNPLSLRSSLRARSN